MPKHMAPAKRGVPVLPVVVGLVLVACVVVAVIMIMNKQEAKREEPAQVKESAQTTKPTQEAAPEPEASKATYATEVARMFAQGEVNSVRLIGDSITAGYGTRGYPPSDTADSWANAFRAYAEEHGVTSFVNAGVNGEFMKTLAQDPDAWIGEGADVVFVALGTNDAGYYGPDEYRADAQTGLEAVAQKAKVVVVLSPVCDLRDEAMLVEPAGDLGDILHQICDEKGYLFVDPRDAVTPEMFNNDGLHPTTEGSLAIWSCIQQTLGL